LPVLRGMLCCRQVKPANSSHHKDLESVHGSPSQFRGRWSIYPYNFTLITRNDASLSNTEHLVTPVALPADAGIGPASHSPSRLAPYQPGGSISSTILKRNKTASSTKQDVAMEFYGLPTHRTKTKTSCPAQGAPRHPDGCTVSFSAGRQSLSQNPGPTAPSAPRQRS
jgi:hypothetical protein